MTVDHIGKHSVPGNLASLLEKSGNNQGISYGLESGHPELTAVGRSDQLTCEFFWCFFVSLIGCTLVDHLAANCSSHCALY